MKCPTCGEEYQRLGRHWYGCGFPEISDRQYELVKGLLMGDGNIDYHGKNPSFRMSNSNEEFIHYVSDGLQWLAYKPFLRHTAEELAERNKEAGMTVVDGGKHYKDQYFIEGVSHPELTPFSEWYRSGEKKYPEDLELSPLALKMWYCCDGGITWMNDKSHASVRIMCMNESDFPEFLESLLGQLGIESTAADGKIIVMKDSHEDFFDVMGEAPSGMEYKWERDDYTKYEEMR